MGFFSRFSRPTPDRVAAEIFAKIVDLSVRQADRDLADSEGVDLALLVSQRVQLRAGFAADILVYGGSKRHHPAYTDVGRELDKLLDSWARSRPGVDAVAGENAMRDARNRYTIKEPSQLAALVWSRLRPGDVHAPSPALQSWVHECVRTMAIFALDAVRPLEDCY